MTPALVAVFCTLYLLSALVSVVFLVAYTAYKIFTKGFK